MLLIGVQSVLNYYQNSRAKLDRVVGRLLVDADYIDHFTHCVRNPTAVVDGTPLKMPCTAAYGAPVMPWEVLGGFPGERRRRRRRRRRRGRGEWQGKNPR